MMPMPARNPKLPFNVERRQQLRGPHRLPQPGRMRLEHIDEQTGEPINRYALFIEEVGGMEKIHDCQNNANEEIYMKAYNIIEKYFSDEDEDAGQEIGALGPQVGQDGTFGFGQQQQQQNFNFGNNTSDSMDM